MLAEVATLVISESAVIGDYDTIRRTLDKVLLRSQFASAQFIDLQGGIIRIDTPQNAKKYAPGWLNAKIEDELLDINRNIVVGGREYGILRLRFATETVRRTRFRDTGISLTCSIGIAICPDGNCAYDNLFRSADEQLYHVKRSGKNGFHIA